MQERAPQCPNYDRCVHRSQTQTDPQPLISFFEKYAILLAVGGIAGSEDFRSVVAIQSRVGWGKLGGCIRR